MWQVGGKCLIRTHVAPTIHPCGTQYAPMWHPLCTLVAPTTMYPCSTHHVPLWHPRTHVAPTIHPCGTHILMWHPPCTPVAGGGGRFGEEGEACPCQRGPPNSRQHQITIPLPPTFALIPLSFLPVDRDYLVAYAHCASHA